jgi:hypothetical protein
MIPHEGLHDWQHMKTAEHFRRRDRQQAGGIAPLARRR